MNGGRVGLIDYGAGNYTSVLNALRHLDCDVVPARAPEDLDGLPRAILPGVGAFPAAMRRLEQRAMPEAIADLIASGAPFLGICVGMQLLASLGHEFERYPGLGAIPGEVELIDADGLRLPHVGWNAVSITRPDPLFADLGPSPTFYFVHSYQFLPSDDDAVLAACEYGGAVTAAVGADNVYGVQFHPEKSQQAGLRLLRNFSRLESQTGRTGVAG